MIIKKPQFMFDEDGDGGGMGDGGDGGDPSQLDPNPSPEPKPSPTLVDASAFAREFGGVLAEQFKQRESNQPKVYTPEEQAQARKALNFYDITPEFITRFGNLETQKAALEEFRDGLFNQNLTVFRAMLEQERAAWEDKFKPVQGVIQDRQAQEQTERFHKTYPVLANPKLESLKASVGQSLLKSGAFNGKTESQAFEILAKGMEEVIQVNAPEFSLGQSAQPSASGRNGNSITPTRHGSGGGGSGGDARGESSGSKAPKGISLFPKIRN